MIGLGSSSKSHAKSWWHLRALKVQVLLMVDIIFVTVLSIYYMCTAKKENIKESAAKCYMSRMKKASYKSKV